MEKDFIPLSGSRELIKLGFKDKTTYVWSKRYSDKYTLRSSEYTRFESVKAITWSQAFRFFRKRYQLYTHFVPEFYSTGINFNWRILWYLPEEEQTDRCVCTGTCLYGDNGEYPTQEKADWACLKELIEIAQYMVTNKGKTPKY